MIAFDLPEDELLVEQTALRFAGELRAAERRHEAAGYDDAARARYRALGLDALALDLPLAAAARAWEAISAGDPAAPIGLGVPGLASLTRSAHGARLAAARVRGAIVVVDDIAHLPADPHVHERSTPGVTTRARSPRDRVTSDLGALAGYDLALAARDCGTAIAFAAFGEAAVGARRSDAAARRSTVVDVPWVPCHRPAWLAVVTPDGVALAGELEIRDVAGRPCGLRAAGAAAVAARALEPIGDAVEAARWLVELRVLAAACMLGAARDAAAYARRYARERVAFGRPIAHHQGLAFQLVDAATELDAAGLLLGDAAASEDPAEVAQAHALVVETTLHAAERSLQALGGQGYLADHPIEKRLRDIRALASLYGGAIASERDAVEAVLAIPDPLELPR